MSYGLQILSSRTEVQSELVQQVLLFFGQNRRSGMVEICEFLRPFLNFWILRVPFSNSSSSLFARQLISSMASFCCSFPDEAIPVLKLLIGCLKHASHKNSDVSMLACFFYLFFYSDGAILSRCLTDWFNWSIDNKFNWFILQCKLIAINSNFLMMCRSLRTHIIFWNP